MVGFTVTLHSLGHKLRCSERRAFAAGAMCMYSSIVYTVHQHGWSVFGVQIINFRD